MVSTDANNVTDPTWACFVDGIKFSDPPPTSQPPENNWVLCILPEIESGSHELTIQVQSTGRAFYFDHLYYWPLADAVFETAVLVYQNTDPALTYSSGWTSSNNQRVTNENGAQVALNFHGAPFRRCFTEK